ncbi:S-methyl-5'-thioadenosine phosphorylase [Bemisia tabaci]|uniref:S-methyl-5'-thioadenosine phosphorylase n=1 Tax=Bemisia tabaci TaxID=7038 RepID=UPI003B27FA77
MKHPIKIGIIGGSGLNNPKILENAVEKDITTPYGKPSDVLIEGTIGGKPCVLLARHGRQHNINPSNVNYRANIYALKKVGCTHVIVSTATGSLKEEIVPGDLVVVDSFIDRTQHRVQTFFDGSELNPSVCHVPMEPAFCNKTRKILIETAQELGFKCHPSGTAVTIEGPRFSSRAESNLFRSWDAHLVNMTLVPEVVLAKEAGLCYAAVAMATDYDSWRDKGEKVNVASVLKIFRENVEKITTLFTAVIPKIHDANWTEEIKEAKACVLSSIMSSNKELNDIINLS